MDDDELMILIRYMNTVLHTYGGGATIGAGGGGTCTLHLFSFQILVFFVFS